MQTGTKEAKQCMLIKDILLTQCQKRHFLCKIAILNGTLSSNRNTIVGIFGKVLEMIG